MVPLILDKILTTLFSTSATIGWIVLDGIYNTTCILIGQKLQLSSSREGMICILVWGCG